MNESEEMNKETYLLNYRNGLWTAIREKEKICWQFLTFYVGAIAILPSFGLDKIGIEITILSIFLLTTWGYLIVVDVNFWFVRNLKIITSIENLIANFLYTNKILPNDYSRPKFQYLLSYRTILRMLGLIYLSSLLYFASQKIQGIIFSSILSWVIIFVAVLITSLWIFLEEFGRRKEYAKFCEETSKEESITDPTLIKKKEVTIELNKTNKYNYLGPVIPSLAAAIQFTCIFLILITNDHYIFSFYSSTILMIKFGLFFWPFAIWVLGIFIKNEFVGILFFIIPTISFLLLATYYVIIFFVQNFHMISMFAN